MGMAGGFRLSDRGEEKPKESNHDYDQTESIELGDVHQFRYESARDCSDNQEGNVLVTGAHITDL